MDRKLQWAGESPRNGEGVVQLPFSGPLPGSDSVGVEGPRSVPVRHMPQMILMLQIQAPLFGNTPYCLNPDLLKWSPELRNVWSGIFKD